MGVLKSIFITSFTLYFHFNYWLRVKNEISNDAWSLWLEFVKRASEGVQLGVFHYSLQYFLDVEYKVITYKEMK